MRAAPAESPVRVIYASFEWSESGNQIGSLLIQLGETLGGAPQLQLSV
jgi:hypothetical protein